MNSMEKQITILEMANSEHWKQAVNPRNTAAYKAALWQFEIEKAIKGVPLDDWKPAIGVETYNYILQGTERSKAFAREIWYDAEKRFHQCWSKLKRAFQNRIETKGHTGSYANCR